MRVYVSGTIETVGAERFRVQWETVKAGSENKDDFDPVIDSDTHYRYFPTIDVAAKFAQKTFDTTELTFGIVTVERQRAEAYESDKRFGYWLTLDGLEGGHEIIIDAVDSYDLWKHEQEVAHV